MGERYLSEVDVDAALKGIQLCLENAAELIREAEILEKNGAPARSIVLAVVALEELGKLPKLVNFGRYGRQGRWSDFWKSFRSHVDKLDMHATVVELSLNDDEAEVVSWIARQSSLSSLHELKMECLYVDWENDGFGSPSERADRGEVARKLIHVTRDSLDYHRERAGRLTRERLSSLQSRFAAFEDQTREVAGPTEFVDALRAEKAKSNRER